MKMSNQPLKYIVQGISIALLIYVASSGVVPLILAPAYAQQAPLFSVTLIASTGNPVRRQYASIITRNLIAVGIDAKLFYLNFDAVITHMSFLSAPQGATFDQGGNDMSFIGYGYTVPVPDFRSNYDGRPAFLAPTGNNYALYNSPEMNALFDKLYTSTDPAVLKDLTWKYQEILFRDKPYNFILSNYDIVARASKWSNYGSKDVYSVVTYPDIQHWSGGSQLVMAEASNVFPGNNLNPAVTESSNTFYAVYMYGPIFSGSGFQDVSPVDLSFYPAVATSIKSSADGKDWTVQIRKGVNFQDGVEVTADDFLYTLWIGLSKKAASVGLGSNIQYLGNVVDFTWLNGTTTTQDNREKPTDTVTKGSWKSVDRYTVQWHMPDVYAFTGQIYAALAAPPAGPLPKHIMEQFDPSTWDSQDFSTAVKAHTYTWDTAKYGGTGSYTAVGPIGAGPYKMVSFDPTTNTATLKKWSGYWNTTGLEKMGQFTVDTYKVTWISSKDAAIAALKNGEVDTLDNNYLPGAADLPTFQAMGVTVIKHAQLGWQEQGFNLRHPVFGTGVATPLGKSDPSKAAAAALHVRTAISHLIPRQQIVDQLLGGLGEALATNVGAGWGIWQNTNLKPDSFDLNVAADELRAAGYTVNVAPPAPIAYSGTPLLGTGTVTVSGVTGTSHMLVVIQQSTDGKTWTPVAAAVADNSTKYSVSVPGPPAFGSIMYRANFTGYDVNDTLAARPITPALVNQYINSGAAFGGTARYASVTDPITVSSTTNDALVVLAVIIVIVVIGALAARSRRKK
jgi:peptide/nickel transport system substrate-binding protein